jgi:GNAT superfamily N-acetyltransferase
LTGPADPALLGAVPFETHPVTPDRVDDFVAVVNPNRRATHCWCLSHRLVAREVQELGGGNREAAFRALCERPDPPGVIGYADGEPVGWCSIGPRADNTRLSRSTLIRPLDDLPVWSIICVVIRGGHRKRGHTTPLIEGAVAHAAARGAPAVESYPVDAAAGRIDTTMAFVGTRAMFEKAGFRVVGTTDALASKLPRLIMRRTTG